MNVQAEDTGASQGMSPPLNSPSPWQGEVQDISVQRTEYIDTTLQNTLDRVIEDLLAQYSRTPQAGSEGQLPPPAIDVDSLAVTLIDLGQAPACWAHHNGDRLLYPASVIKLFYLVASHVWEDAGKLTPSAELDRARRNAIVDSSNDATSLLVDLLTGTTSGPELAEPVFSLWQKRRNVVTRYFQALGIPCNICQKTWSDGPYGRDRQSYKLLKNWSLEDLYSSPATAKALGASIDLPQDNRNALSTNGTAWLLHSIAAGQVVDRGRSQQMLQLMARDLEPSTYQGDPDNQIQGFLGEGLPLNAQLWSKAGETSFCRHDCALIRLPGKAPYIVVAFGDGPNYFNNWNWLPTLSKLLQAALRP